MKNGASKRNQHREIGAKKRKSPAKQKISGRWRKIKRKRYLKASAGVIESVIFSHVISIIRNIKKSWQHRHKWLAN